MRTVPLLLFLLTASAAGQTVRLTAPIDETRRVILKGTIHPRTRTAVDLGPVEPSRKISPVAVLLKRSAEQQAGLAKLLEAQRNLGSPSFHRWLTSEQYADRFGMAEEDISTIRSWIESHGLTVDHSARGRNWIGFSGTAQQMESAFGTQLHRYRSGAEEYFASATEISIPAALEPAVGAFIGLDDFRPKPQYTSPSGAHALAPDDIAIIYDITPLYNSGINGTGQKIVVVGQSDLEPNLADIRAFRNKFNLPGADPQVILYGPDPGVNGALPEADLDLEWSAAVAGTPLLFT
jgi:subtilase family serine protease